MSGHESGKEKSGRESSDRGRDLPRWTRYVEVLGRPLSAIIAGLAVAVIGFMGQQALQNQQSAQVYTEILSQREQAESSIRKDMFTAILDRFFAQTPPDSANIEDQLLRLEVLALNFSETLSLSPLFRELDRTINEEGTYSGLLARVDRATHRKRLHGLASRVNGWQLSRLGVEGRMFEFDVGVQELFEEPRSVTYTFPDLELDGVVRDYVLVLSQPDTLLKTVQVSISIVTESTPDQASVRPTERPFQLSFYDFPLIDNTRLSHDQRFALVLNDFTQHHIGIEAVVFPGQYATHREGSTLPALVEAMRRNGDEGDHR